MVEESLTGKVTSEQEFIMARHSRMVGRVLDLVEASLPEGNQCDKLKWFKCQHQHTSKWHWRSGDRCT